MTPQEIAELKTLVGEVVTDLRGELKTANDKNEALERAFGDYKSANEIAMRRASIYGGEMRDGEMRPAERQAMLVNMIGNQLRATAWAKGDHARAERIVREHYKDERTADWMKQRNLTEGVFSDGGALVDTQYSSEIIDLLYPMAVVRRAGATVLPMPLGNLTIDKIGAGVTGQYQGEAKDLAVQQQSFGQLNLAAKKLGVIIPISNELANDSSGKVNKIIIRDLGMGLSLREDLAFIRGDGTNNTPLGIRNSLQAGSILAAGSGLIATPTLKDVLQKLRAKIKTQNVPMLAMGWLFNADFESALYNATTTTGFYIYRDEMDGGKLMGFPFYVTNQIASNYGGLTEVYFGDFSEAIIAETYGITIDSSTEGSYFNGTTLVSAFSTDQLLVRARERHDFGLRHVLSFAVALINPFTILP